MREYYIRREGDEDASGPFDIDQISSLIEANKLDANAYYYDIETESWLLISSNEELMDTLFPKKRKLGLRTEESEAEKKRLAEEEAVQKAIERAKAEEARKAAGETLESENSAEDAPAEEAVTPDKKKKKEPSKKEKRKAEENKKLEVTRMLAQAEGRDNDASGKSPREKQAAVAFIGLRFLTLFFAASVLCMSFLEYELLLTANALAMAKSPFLIVAAFDLIVVVTLLLQVTEVYPLLRFRAAVGAGLFTLLFYSSGDTILLLSNLLLMGAIYFCSAMIKVRFLTVCTGAGVLGILGYIYTFFLS